MDKQADLVGAIVNKYQVGPLFAKAYLTYWQESRGQTFTNLQEILDLPAPQPMWFEYALSTNQRGKALYQCLLPHLTTSPRRYLDVGCGFGGCLVAFAAHNMEVIGIEPDVQRVGFSQANCQDHGLADVVYPLSILEDNLRDRLGTFDLITCNDVIEHVLDIPTALENMVALLNPGGVLFLEIPNKHSLNFVGRDGHFNLFGITLLERPDAIEYHRHFFGTEYDVGYYYGLYLYQDKLEQLGCRPHLIPSELHAPRPLHAASALVDTALQRHHQFCLNQKDKLPAFLTAKINTHFRFYLATLVEDLAGLSTGERDFDWFQQKYLMDFWTLMAQKS